MKKLAIYIIILFVLGSCDKYPNPGTEIFEQLNFQIKGTNQLGEVGIYLTDSIGIMIDEQSLEFARTKLLTMEIEVIEGGGSVDETVLHFKESRRMLTRWKMGDQSNVQRLLATTYDSDGNIFTETEFTANVFFYDKWNIITSGYLTRIRDMVVDSVNNRSLMIAGGDLYMNGDKFYEWIKISNYQYPNFKDIEINSKGEIYGGGWDGNLYKSDNWGQSWNLVCSPIPDNVYNYELTVTDDDYIWANKWEYGIYCSKDGGLTWHNDTIGLVIKEQLGRVYKLIDSHLAISQNQLKILQSFDDGITWETIITPEYSIDLFVTDENEIIAYNQERGFSLHKSTDVGLTYKRVLSGSVAYGTWPMSHTFKKFRNNYYILAPGGGIYKTKDFEEFEKIVSFNLQRNLFIDHTGTIYAGCFSNEPVLILPNNE